MSFLCFGVCERESERERDPVAKISGYLMDFVDRKYPPWTLESVKKTNTNKPNGITNDITPTEIA